MAEKSIFSKIIAREIPATIEYEDDEFIAIRDIDPKAPQHVLLIPKTEYTTLESVDFDDDAFHARILKLARKIAKDIGIGDNYKLIMNVGTDIQEVHHIHLHIMGGWDFADMPR